MINTSKLTEEEQIVIINRILDRKIKKTKKEKEIDSNDDIEEEEELDLLQ